MPLQPHEAQIRRNGDTYHWHPCANKNSSKQKILRSQQKKSPQQYQQMTFLGCTKNNWQQLSVVSPSKNHHGDDPGVEDGRGWDGGDFGDVDWMEDVGWVLKNSWKMGECFHKSWMMHPDLFFKLKSRGLFSYIPEIFLNVSLAVHVPES